MGKIKGDTTSVINGSNYIAQCGKKFSMKFHKMRQSTSQIFSPQVNFSSQIGLQNQHFSRKASNASLRSCNSQI